MMLKSVCTNLRRVRLSWLICAWLLAACSSQPALPNQTSAELAQRAADQMERVKSLHFAIELTGDLTYIDPAGLLALKRAEGDLNAPDRVRATIRTRTLGATTDIDVIGVGTAQWARNPANGRWETLPPEFGSFDIGALFSAEYGLPAVLRSQTFERKANETLNERAHYLLATTTAGETLSRMTSGMITDGTVGVTLWIDGETLRPAQIVLIEQDTDPDEPTRWQITLDRFDQTVEIVPPPAQ